MGMTLQLPDWTLNYQVATFGAYATILVESFYLILGGFENTTLLSISILTNGSAVIAAGFGGAFSTPLAIIRICLTSFYLLSATILQENDTFDGTYAILCSIAHLTYHLPFQHNGDDSEGFLPQHENAAKIDQTLTNSCIHSPSMDCNDEANFSRYVRIFFGDYFCLEGTMVPVTILGTVMTYRVFDFDLGFGLVFAFMSAFLSSVILIFINCARMRGRQMEIKKALQQLLSLIISIGAFCYIFFSIVDFSDIDFSWWRIAFGLAWFMFLFKTTYYACRYLIHPTLSSCTACSQRGAGIYGPLTQDVSVGCVWEDNLTLPALNESQDDGLSGSTTFRIRRQKGPDLVDRFWLNNQELFQISPRTFVILFVSCISLASLSGGALNPEGSFASIGSHLSKNIAFYLTIVFTFVSTGHTPVGDAPELIFVPLRHSFPHWKAIARAIIATTLIHAYLVIPAFSKADISYVTPIACTIVAPLLLAGIAKNLDSIGRGGKHTLDSEANTVLADSDKPTSSTSDWTINQTLVYTSSRIRCLDFRVLILGISVTLFDVLCNQYQDERLVKRWPTSAAISLSVLALWLYLENSVSGSRDVEPGILSIAATSLVGIFSHVSFLNSFGLYNEESEGGNVTHTAPVPDNGRHFNPILIALWYTTLISMVVVNRRLVQRKTEQTLPATNGQLPREDYLLFDFHVRMSSFKLAWKLRNSRVAISLVFAMLASYLGESWPLDMNITAAGLLLFVLVVGFQLQTGCDNLDERRSLPHIASLAFSILVTILAIGLSRHGLLYGLVSDPKRDWKSGSWAALVCYQGFLAASLRMEGKGWFAREDRVKEPSTGGNQDEKKATAQEGEESKISDATSNN